MNQTSKTMQFVVAAIVSVVIAGFTSWITKPKPSSDFKDLNTEFFPDLTDPSAATALRVVAFNETTASAKIFTVEKKDGVWRIPSHHNYPADGKDRLAKTSTSLLSTKRSALVSRVVTDHERYGVLDPLDEKAEALKGRGQRITLYKSSDIVVADLIIGNKVEGKESYYVRRPDETKTYIADLKIDLSTKFKDWVEDDLLKVEKDNLVRLESRRTEITNDGEVKADAQILTRAKAADPWTLSGLDDATEELNKTDLEAMVGVVDNLKLVGIRERPQLEGKSLLRNDLSVNLPAELKQNRQILKSILDQLRGSLQEKGFMVYHDQKTDQAQLYSSEGDLVATTSDGVQYHMSFGNVFSGTDDEVEFGGAEKKDGQDKKEAKPDQKPEDPPKSPAEGDTDGKKDTGKKSRYLFLRTTFDETALGPKPTEPAKPEVPAGVEVDENGNPVVTQDAGKPADAKDTPAPSKTETKSEAKSEGGEAECGAQEEKKEEAATPEAKKDEPKPEPKKDDAPAVEAAKPEAAKPEAPKVEVPKEDPVETYKKNLAKYRSEKAKFDSDLKAYDKKVEDGKKKVKELNDRFGAWYYVISAEDFDKLRLKRDQLVKLKVVDKKDAATNAPKSDEATTKPDAEPAKPDAAKPDAAKPEGDAKKTEPEPKPAEEKKADEKKTEEKKADEKPE
jgi:hypothetical protein